MAWFDFSWQNFWFSFLALIFEGIPFVHIGSLISGPWTWTFLTCRDTLPKPSDMDLCALRLLT